jgi:glyoxylase I family protein
LGGYDRDKSHSLVFEHSELTIMQTTENTVKISLAPGNLRRVHHIALNVRDMKASRHFYGTILGLQELTGAEIPASLTEMVAAGKVANFITPDDCN